MKIKSDTDNGAMASKEMLVSIFKDLKRFKSFYDFLISVRAMEKRGKDYIAIKFHMSDLGNYESAFVRPHKAGSLNDDFVFESKSTIYTVDNDGNKRKTGYFLPMDFWTHVFNKIKYEKLT